MSKVPKTPEATKKHLSVPLAPRKPKLNPFLFGSPKLKSPDFETFFDIPPEPYPNLGPRPSVIRAQVISVNGHRLPKPKDPIQVVEWKKKKEARKKYFETYGKAINTKENIKKIGELVNDGTVSMDEIMSELYATIE